ncbi:MAG: FAD binding domain-containing protein [Acidimicrobiales bacterium]
MKLGRSDPRYPRPTSIGAAAEILAEDGAYPLAGGTDFVVLHQDGLVSPKSIVDLKHVPELRNLVRTPRSLSIASGWAARGKPVDPALEQIVSDATGRTVNDSLVDYRMPTAADIPDEVEILAIEDFPSPVGPFGAKGTGEAPVILPGATLASAASDATGLRLVEPPMSSDRIVARLWEGVA